MRAKWKTIFAVTIAAAAGCTIDDSPTTEQVVPASDYNEQLDGITPEQDVEASMLDDLASQPADDVPPGDEGTAPPEDDDSDDTGTADAEAPTADAAEAGAEGADAVDDVAFDPKIKYILVIVKENHTFDNYFTGFPGAEWSKTAIRWNSHTHRDEEFTRPFAPDGKLPTAPEHGHGIALDAWRAGHMDGFSVNHGMTPYMRYRESQIPAYWKYAKNFVLADNFFSESLAPSAPGHETFWFARSTTIDDGKCHLPGGVGCGKGCESNHFTATTFNPRTGVERSVKPCFDLPSLPDHLPSHYTWVDYGGQMAKQIKSQRHVSADHYESTPKLLADMKVGKLHNLMIAHISGGPYSEHPPQGPCVGENYTVDVINAAMQLPQWKHMAIIVTWDDWGGLYDHVKPKVQHALDGRVFGRGFRLPLLVISPYAKHGVVLHTRTEQASVPRLVEELWKMKFMTERNAHARDGVAGSLKDAFDFSQPPRDPVLLQTRTCPNDEQAIVDEPDDATEAVDETD
jgi:phospholipase C